MSVEEKYKERCNTSSDINEHLPTLFKYAQQCESVAELGVRGVVSSYAFLWGLIQNNSNTKVFYIFDISYCDVSEITQDAFYNHVELVDYIPKNDLLVDISDDSYDLTFVDTFHCYPHCYEELSKFHSKTNKYIILHDTTIDGETSECVRLGYESNHYDSLVQQYNNKYTIDEFKMGLQFAVARFLKENPNWRLLEKFENNNGLTVLTKC